MHGTHAFPRRRIVATFDSFGDAQSTVDRLLDAHLPPDRATILAEGLRLVGRPTLHGDTRPTVGLGALTGAVVGTLLAWAFGLVGVSGGSLPAVVAMGLLVGVAVGAASGWLAARIVALRRATLPRTGLDAERFSVVVDEELADEAVRILRLTVAGSRSIASIGGARPWAPTDDGGGGDTAAPG